MWLWDQFFSSLFLRRHDLKLLCRKLLPERIISQHSFHMNKDITESSVWKGRTSDNELRNLKISPSKGKSQLWQMSWTSRILPWKTPRLSDITIARVFMKILLWNYLWKMDTVLWGEVFSRIKPGFLSKNTPSFCSWMWDWARKCSAIQDSPRHAWRYVTKRR